MTKVWSRVKKSLPGSNRDLGVFIKFWGKWCDMYFRKPLGGTERTKEESRILGGWHTDTLIWAYSVLSKFILKLLVSRPVSITSYKNRAFQIKPGWDQATPIGPNMLCLSSS